MEILSEAHDDSSGANPSSVKSDDGSPPPDGDRGSPPPNCAICLGRCRNKSFTDSCLHQFCFKCLVTWSKVKTECPLCKQNFKSIIHNVQSNQQYEEYRVEQRRQEEDRIDIDDLVTATRRFRYRTTLTIPRGGEHIALQRLLMHYPPLSAMVGMSRDLPGITPAALPSSRRRRSPSSFRRTVYRHNLWARPLPDFTGRHRDCTPEFYRYNHSQMHRLVPWLNRELHYLLLENAGHITYVLSRIMELLPQYHITSPEFREDMYRYFGTRTDHFLHELHCFASTPYDLTGYDRNVQYTTDSRISNTVNDVISSSDTESGDSDIVLVTPRSPLYRSRSTPPYRPVTPILPSPFEGPGPSARRLPDPVYPQNHITSPIEAARLARNVIPIETISNSDTDDDEVMVTGYIKPPSQRTPEVVDLRDSDDSDVVVTEVPPAPDPRGLVKLTLSRARATASPDSDDGDETYTPPLALRGRRLRSSSSDSPRTSRSSSPRTPSPRTPPHDAGEIVRLTRDMERMPNGSPDSRDARGGGRSTRRKYRRSREEREEPVPEPAPVAPAPVPSPTERSTPEPDRREKDKRKKSKSSNGKGVKSSRKDTETNTEPPRTESAVQEEPRPGPSSRPVERKKSSRWDDSSTDYRTAESTAQEEPRPGSSRSAGRAGKSSRRDDYTDSRRAESAAEIREDPQPGSSRSGGRVGKSRKDEPESQRAEATAEARPGPSRAGPTGAPNTLKRKNTEGISSRRNSRESKRLKSVVKKTSSWSSTAQSSSSADPASTSAVRPSTSAVRPSTSAVRPSTSAVRPSTSAVRPSTSAVPTPSSAASSTIKVRRRSSSCESPRERGSPDFFTDSDDDIPLNLTIQRSAGQS